MFGKGLKEIIMTNKRKRLIIAIVAGSILLIPVGGLWWRRESQKVQCIMQMRNYCTLINSCGTDINAWKAWQDPAETEKLVTKLFGEAIPSCPAGGVYRFVYDTDKPREGGWPPRLACSLEQKHGHVCPSLF